jgi:hypothetical protein
MSRKVEVSNIDYLSFKNKVLENKVLTRFDTALSEVSVEDLKTITIQGRTLQLTQKAIVSLTESLGISSSFVKTLKSGLGNEDNKTILNYIIKSIKNKKVDKLTFIYNRPMQEITNVYPAGAKLIEDSQYFEALEKLISRTPGSYLRNITQVANGDLNAVIANPKLEFQFGGLSEEVFTSGITLDLTSKQMMTSFFTERLWCTNGCTTRDKLASREVHMPEKVPEFLTSILDSDYHLNSIMEFKKRINRCYNTTASLGEVLNVGRRLENMLGNYNGSLTDQMSTNRLKMAFGEERLLDTANYKFLNTDISLWDLVNEITAVSSRIEQHRIPVAEKTNLQLQIMGGDLMFRTPDLCPSNVKQIFMGV